MATETWDENGWRARVTYMRDVMMEGRRFTDEMTEDLVSYFTFAFVQLARNEHRLCRV